MSEWNATLYDNKHDFVAEYGKGLLEYIPQNKNHILCQEWPSPQWHKTIRLLLSGYLIP